MKTFKQFLEERKYWGTEAAGTIFIANDTKRILFLKRSKDEDSEQEQWEITIGGKKDEDDIDATQTRDREAFEEIGEVDNIIETKLIEIFMDTGDDHKSFKYYTYVKIIKNEFKPKLSHEHTAFKWVHVLNEEIPEPKHFAVDNLIKNPLILELI